MNRPQRNNMRAQGRQEDIVNEIKRRIPQILAGDSENIIQNAERLVKEKLRRMSTAQIRKIFSEVKSMKEYKKYDLDLMRAKLAYVSGRHKETIPLVNVLDEAIKQVNDSTKFKHFQDFFEAIVAYHKKHGSD